MLVTPAGTGHVIRCQGYPVVTEGLVKWGMVKVGHVGVGLALLSVCLSTCLAVCVASELVFQAAASAAAVTTAAGEGEDKRERDVVGVCSTGGHVVVASVWSSCSGGQWRV